MKRPHLTPRQKEVIQLRRLEYGPAEIARHLSISIHTVDYHWRRIFARLHVRTQAAALLACDRNIGPTQLRRVEGAHDRHEVSPVVAAITLTPPEIALELELPVQTVYKAFRIGKLTVDVFAGKTPTVFPYHLHQVRADVRRWARKQRS